MVEADDCQRREDWRAKRVRAVANETLEFNVLGVASVPGGPPVGSIFISSRFRGRISIITETWPRCQST